jgi:chromate transporter
MLAQPNVSLISIFSVFARIGVLSFGGGMSGWVYRETVQARQWLTEDEFLSSLAISQILPGANISNLAVCIGQKLRGGVGATVALFALLVGPFFAVLGLAGIYDILKDASWLENVLDGVTAAALGMLVLICYRSARRASRNPPAAIALVATFVCVGILRMPLIPVVVAIGPASVYFAWQRGLRRGG